LHKGEPGADGTTSISLSSITGTATYKKLIQVNSAATGFEYTAQKVGDSYYPASIASTPSGNPAYTLCSIGVAAQAFDWRPQVAGYTIITGTGTNVTVDLIARLNDAAAGNIVGRCPGVTSTERLILSEAGAPPGSADSYDKVAAGAAVTIYLRAERQTGTDTFTTSNTTTRFKVKVNPVP
jgi:hypothetical protein